MAVVKFAIGTELDIATGDELSSGLGSIRDILDRRAPKPLFLSFSGSISSPGVINLGRPPSGRIWNILSYTLVGSDDKTVVAATTAALYVDSDPSSLGLALCRIPGQIVPSFQVISDETLWAHSSGAVCINVVGNGTSQVLATITVAEWREMDVIDGFAGRA